MEEIFEHFGMALRQAIPSNRPYKFAMIELERQPNMAGYRAYLENDGREYLMPDKFKINSDSIHDLYNLTVGNGDKSDWNKAFFKFYPNKKFEIEFQYDDQL